MYKYLLFDIDDTLLVLDDVQSRLLFQAVNQQQPYADQSLLFSTFLKHSSSGWQQLLNEEISLSQFRYDRYHKTFAALNIRINTNLAIQCYDEALSNSIDYIDNSLEKIKIWSESFSLIAFTNGVKESQLKRLKNANMLNYFNSLIAPECCGQAKPHVRIFEYFFYKHQDLKKNEVLVIGDKMETDVLGANSFGFHSCWLNKKSNKKDYSFKPTYTITELSELNEIIYNDR